MDSCIPQTLILSRRNQKKRFYPQTLSPLTTKNQSPVSDFLVKLRSIGSYTNIYELQTLVYLRVNVQAFNACQWYRHLLAFCHILPCYSKGHHSGCKVRATILAHLQTAGTDIQPVIELRNLKKPWQSNGAMTTLFCLTQHQDPKGRRQLPLPPLCLGHSLWLQAFSPPGLLLQLPHPRHQ